MPLGRTDNHLSIFILSLSALPPLTVARVSNESRTELLINIATKLKCIMRVVSVLLEGGRSRGSEEFRPFVVPALS